VNRYLVKIAKKLEEGDRPHQAAALEKLNRVHGIILNHGLGSGKTKVMLRAVEQSQTKNKTGRELIVAPASLVTNIDHEIKKHGLKIDRSRLDVYSYERAVNLADELAKNQYNLTVSDEAHRLRNPSTKRAKALADIFSRSNKRILATGTSVYNSPGDIAPLINMAAGEKLLPEDKKEFNKRFVKSVDKPRSLADRILGRVADKKEVITRRNELGDIFEKHVSYYEPKDDPTAKDKFPEVTERVIESELSPEQAKVYKFLEGQLPFWMKMKIRYNLPMDKQEKTQLNSFSTGIRQASNTHRHYTSDPDSVEFSPKIDAAYKELKKGFDSNKNHKVLAYSNFLPAGVEEYSRKLSKEGVKHSTFTGSMSKEEKDKAVEAYNSGKTPVLIISGSGAEGLNLKGTRAVQILDPFWNKSRIEQVAGRGARFESHTHLPKDQQKMEVQHFLSVHPKGLFGKAPNSIDSYLVSMSDDKKELATQITDIMKEKSQA
jgi:SNF2 family DNA or RNA helicase